MSKTYTEGQRVTALAALAANGGNISKTARQTGIPRITLRKWQASELNDLPEVATIKKEFADDFMEKLKRTRSRLIDRIYTVAEHEQDIYKLSGAFKTVMDAASEQEVNEALAERIRGASEAQAAPRPEGAGSPGGTAARLN